MCFGPSTIISLNNWHQISFVTLKHSLHQKEKKKKKKKFRKKKKQKH
jgi:hypothetical protein